MNDVYLSPFTNRYSEALRTIFSPLERERAWRRVWLAVLSAQVNGGLVHVTAAELLDLEEHMEPAEPGSNKFEDATKHELVAALYRYREECNTPAAGLLHLGLTSSDVMQMGLDWQFRAAMLVLMGQLRDLAMVLDEGAGKVQVMLGRTHGQPAEMTTWDNRIGWLRHHVSWAIGHSRLSMQPVRGLGGVIGNGGTMGRLAWFSQQDGGGWLYETPEDCRCAIRQIEEDVLEKLFPGGFYLSPAITQTADLFGIWDYLSPIVQAVGAMSKFATDIRLLSALQEVKTVQPTGYIGSSAMPSKVNPIAAENVVSLSRRVHHLHSELWEVASSQWLERSLDDSAFLRFLPELLLGASEVISKTLTIMSITVPVISAEIPNTQIAGDAERILQRQRMAPLQRSSDDTINQLSVWEADMVRRGNMSFLNNERPVI